MNFSIIAAVDQNFGIGIKNKLPWRLKIDMDYFSKITIKAPSGKINAVIMGKNTWESLPKKSRPLPRRLNVVLCEDENYHLPENVLLSNSLDDALSFVEKRSDINEIFVIGGAMLYASSVVHLKCSKIYLTEIQSTFKVDTYFPQIPDSFKKIKESKIFEENNLKFKFCIYKKLE